MLNCRMQWITPAAVNGYGHKMADKDSHANGEWSQHLQGRRFCQALHLSSHLPGSGGLYEPRMDSVQILLTGESPLQAFLQMGGL